MNPNLKARLEELAKKLPKLVDPRMLVRKAIKGEELLKNGIKTTRDGSRISPYATYLYEVPNEVDHVKGLRAAYQAGNTPEQKEANLQKYCDFVVKKYKETKSQVSRMGAKVPEIPVSDIPGSQNTSMLGKDRLGELLRDS